MQGQSSMAGAYYDSESRRLQILEDTRDTWAWDLCLLCELSGSDARQLTAVCEQCLPDQILLSANAPDSLVNVINEFCEPAPAPSPDVKVKSFLNARPWRFRPMNSNTRWRSTGSQMCAFPSTRPPFTPTREQRWGGRRKTITAQGSEGCASPCSRWGVA